MNRAEAQQKYMGFPAPAFRVCPMCFLVDFHHDNKCLECQHEGSNPFPRLDSDEARRMVLEFLRFVCRGVGVEDRHRRYADAALDIVSDEWTQ